MLTESELQILREAGVAEQTIAELAARRGEGFIALTPEVVVEPLPAPYVEPKRTELVFKGDFNPERLAEEIEKVLPQAVEGIAWGDGEITITLKPGMEGREMPLRAIVAEHDPTKPSKNEQVIAVRQESTLKLQEVDFDALKAGVDEIKSNPVLHSALMGLLALNYRLAAAAGFVSTKPEWVDDQ